MQICQMQKIKLIWKESLQRTIINKRHQQCPHNNKIYFKNFTQSKHQDLWMTKCIMTLNFTDVFAAADYILEKMLLKMKQPQNLLRLEVGFSNILSTESISSRNNYKNIQFKSKGIISRSEKQYNKNSGIIWRYLQLQKQTLQSLPQPKLETI